MRTCRIPGIAALALLAGTIGCAAMAMQPPPVQFAAMDPGTQCRAAIDRAERAYALPPRLLAAIGRVESGRAGPDGRVDPWPYSINAEGTDHIYASKAEAIAGVRALQAMGVRSIDVGCLQVNLMHHPDAFATLDEAFDPVRNADYAARFLIQLKDQTGTWAMATADYHSATPELGEPYAAKVRAAWAEENGHPDAWPPGSAAAPIGGRLAPGRVIGVNGPMGRVIALPMVGNGRGLLAYRANPVRIVSSGLLR
jgi:hypothetical protein